MPAFATPEETTGPVQRRVRPIYRVFVSSTWLDLQPERRALMEALNRMEEMRFVGMEFFGNRPDDTHDASIDQVDLCEVFVGIIGFRYGSGITEAEYRRARAQGLPCFVYFKKGQPAGPDQMDNDPALGVKLADFKAELMRGHTVKEVSSPEELAANATADLHNWVAARWISVEQTEVMAARARPVVADADRTNILRLLERIDQDWIKGVLEASLHHRAWLDLGLDWREDAVEHPWDRIVVAPNRPIQTLSKEDSITGVFDAAQHTLLVLGEPGAGKTTTVLELARDLIARARESAGEPAPVVLALSTWRGQHKNLFDWLVSELGLRYQVPKRVARGWLEEGRLVLILDGLDEVTADRRPACVEAINAFEQTHPPPGLAVTCRVVEYDALTVKLRLRSAICLQPLTPVQIDRYFQAAGTSLASLRQALQDDTGLRDLARSPLMLSVMTMAWREAPAGTTAPFAAAQTPEELRHRLFDAYVQAALRRRGKASGGYPPDQTLTWLTWLARRMKEHGHTLFAIEQLQPGWLDGAWRQFSYFAGSRLLGTSGLVLPFVIMAGTWKLALTLGGLALLTGCYIGAIDYAIARHDWGGYRRAMLRFILLIVGLVFLSFSWVGLSPGEVEGNGTLYLLMVGLAFCAPVDVRALDIKPAGSIQWSSQQAARRGLISLALMTVVVALVLLVTVVTTMGDRGWAQGWGMLGGWPYVMGILVGVVVVAAGWRRRHLAGSLENMAGAAALVLFCGQVGGSLGSTQTGDAGFWHWEMIFAEMWPMLLFGVFGGFGSTLIDPARPQQAGVWFWLRVPVLAFFSLSSLIFIPGLIAFAMSWIINPSDPLSPDFVAVSAVFGAGCGLVAFLRFGGFNGVQHFLLRWLLARGGHLPPKPEAFLSHAAQLALLQKVGLGYRFIHALLLQHLATSGGAAGEGTVDPRMTASVRRPPTERVLHRGAVAVGGAGLLLLACMAAAGFALAGAVGAEQSLQVLSRFLGSVTLALALVIPVVLLAGRWLSRLAWRWVGTGGLALGLLLFWLAQDDPVLRYPAGLPGTTVVRPGTEASGAVLMRYGQIDFGRLQPAAKNFKWTGFRFSQGPEQGKIWQDFLPGHRTEIEANWMALAPVRAWLDELNAFDRLADLDTDLLDTTTIAYPVRLIYTKNAMAIAGLQALDGQGDAALATLQPLLEVGGKLEVAARGTGHYDAAREMQAAAIRAAEFVLDTAPVSASARARFATGLTAGGGGTAGARRLHAIHYAMIAGASDSFGHAITAWTWQQFEFLRLPLDLVGPVVFNRRASLNRWGELLADLQDFAVRREPAQTKKRVAAFLEQESRFRFKNIGGSWVTWLASERLGLKAASLQLKGYWTMEDKRAALLARLRTP